MVLVKRFSRAVDSDHGVPRIVMEASERLAEIECQGLRPGEKLFEEPLADSEKTLPTPHPEPRVAQARAQPRLPHDDGNSAASGTASMLSASV